MNIQQQIKKLQDEILAIKNTKIQNGLTDFPLFDEMIEDNAKEIFAVIKAKSVNSEESE